LFISTLYIGRFQQTDLLRSGFVSARCY